MDKTNRRARYLAVLIVPMLGACATEAVRPRPVTKVSFAPLQARSPVAVMGVDNPDAPPAKLCKVPVGLIWKDFEARLDDLTAAAAGGLGDVLRGGGVVVAADAPKVLRVAVVSATCSEMPSCNHTIVMRVIAGAESQLEFTGSSEGCDDEEATMSAAIRDALERALRSRALRAFVED